MGGNNKDETPLFTGRTGQEAAEAAVLEIAQEAVAVATATAAEEEEAAKKKDNKEKEGDDDGNKDKEGTTTNNGNNGNNKRKRKGAGRGNRYKPRQDGEWLPPSLAAQRPKGKTPRLTGEMLGAQQRAAAAAVAAAANRVAVKNAAAKSGTSAAAVPQAPPMAGAAAAYPYPYPYPYPPYPNPYAMAQQPTAHPLTAASIKKANDTNNKKSSSSWPYAGYPTGYPTPATAGTTKNATTTPTTPTGPIPPPYSQYANTGYQYPAAYAAAASAYTQYAQAYAAAAAAAAATTPGAQQQQQQATAGTTESNKKKNDANNNKNDKEKESVAETENDGANENEKKEQGKEVDKEDEEGKDVGGRGGGEKQPASTKDDNNDTNDEEDENAKEAEVEEKEEDDDEEEKSTKDGTTTTTTTTVARRSSPRKKRSPYHNKTTSPPQQPQPQQPQPQPQQPQPPQYPYWYPPGMMMPMPVVPPQPPQATPNVNTGGGKKAGAAVNRLPPVGARQQPRVAVAQPVAPPTANTPHAAFTNAYNYSVGMAANNIVNNPYAKYSPSGEKQSTTPENKKDLNKDEELPAFIQGLKVMYPKKAELTIDAIKAAEGKPLTYEDKNYHAMHQNGIRNMAEHLDYILYTGSRGNPRNAAMILQSLLRRPNLESVKQNMEARDVQSKESREQSRKEAKRLVTSKVDTVIVQGVKDFLHSHRTSSLRRKHEHDAVEAVLTAACSAGRVIYGRRDPKRLKPQNNNNNTATATTTNDSGDEGQPPQEEQTNNNNNEEGGDAADGDNGNNNKQDRRGRTAVNPRYGISSDIYGKEEFPVDKIAKRLNRSVEEITTFRNEMTGKRFVPRKQKTQEDYYNENPAGACVLEFCHSIEASWPASKNETAHSAFRAVKNPITGEREEHRLRVWHEEATEDRYHDFLQSIAYQKFLLRQRNDPLGINAIGFELFCDSFCPCVLDYHPKGRDRKRKKPDLPLAREELLQIDAEQNLQNQLLVHQQQQQQQQHEQEAHEPPTLYNRW